VVFVDNILCSGHTTQSADPTIDTWESPTLQGQTRQHKLAIWAARLAMLAAAYVLTSGTTDPDDPEDGDVIPDLTGFNYTLVAYRRYDPQTAYRLVYLAVPWRLTSRVCKLPWSHL
jgi:hypothetical protein